MSAYLADSELSRFNRHASPEPFALSADMFAVLALAQQVARESGRCVRRDGRARRRRVGFRARAGAPRRRRRGTAAPRAARRPRATRARPGDAQRHQGAPPARGGPLRHRQGLWRRSRGAGARRARHRPLHGRGRRRGAHARDERRRARHGASASSAPTPSRPGRTSSLPLEGRSLATSGDYRIYFERDGKRFSHEIDPARGAPVDHALASASVVAPDLRLRRRDGHGADGHGTGTRAGLRRRAHGLAAYFIVREGAALRAFASPAFQRLGGRALA